MRSAFAFYRPRCLHKLGVTPRAEEGTPCRQDDSRHGKTFGKPACGFCYRRHRKGLRTGLQCGVLLYLLLVLAGVLWLHEAGTLWKGLALMLSSATGGVAGVNLPRKHPPR